MPDMLPYRDKPNQKGSRLCEESSQREEESQQSISDIQDCRTARLTESLPDSIYEFNSLEVDLKLVYHLAEPQPGAEIAESTLSISGDECHSFKRKWTVTINQVNTCTQQDS